MIGNARLFFRLKNIAEQKYGTVTKERANPLNMVTTGD